MLFTSFGFSFTWYFVIVEVVVFTIDVLLKQHLEIWPSRVELKTHIQVRGNTRISTVEIRISLTKRLELLFLTVLAFPKASSKGFDWRMISFTCCHTHIHTHSETQVTYTTDSNQSRGQCCCLYLYFWSSSWHFGNVAHDIFGSHSLSCTALTTATTTTTTQILTAEVYQRQRTKTDSPTLWWHTGFLPRSSCFCTCCPSGRKRAGDSHTGPGRREQICDDTWSTMINDGTMMFYSLLLDTVQSLCL